MYNGALFSLKKERYCVTYYNMDAPWGHYINRNKAVTKGQNCMIPTTWGIESSQIQRQKEWWLSDAGERGEMESYCSIGRVLHDEKSLWMEGSYRSQQYACTYCCWTEYLKMVKMVHFILCLFYHNLMY